MSNHSLRTVVAVSLRVIETDNGFISPSKSAKSNTQSKVFDELKANPSPKLDNEYWDLADEVIEFFRIAETTPEYKSILQRADGSLYQTCIDAVKKDEVTALTFPFIVQMPHLYGKLKPREPVKLDPAKTEAKIVQPGEFFGKLNKEDRFFVKLVRVGDFDKSKGGNLFEVRDRSNNIGFFYERPERLENEIQLGDCFAMHAIPSSHRPAPNGEKHTIFRSVQIVDNKGRGTATVDPKMDVTGKFCKTIPF